MPNAFARVRSDRAGAAPFEVIDVSVYFTSICNSGCLTCDIWKNRDRVEFPLDAFERLADDPATVGATFALLGGEFTLHSRYLDVLAHLERRRAPFVVLTNAILPARVRRMFDVADVRNLSVSVDGAHERHDEVRGHRGNFAGVLEVVRWVKREHPRTFLRFYYTASQFNSLDDLRAVVRVARDEGVDDVRVGAVTGAALYAQTTSANRRLADPELYRFEDVFPDDKYLALYRPWRRGWSAPCTGTRHHPMVLEDGALVLCPALGRAVTLGNVVETPFGELWGSAAVRAKIEGYASCNACWMSCTRKYDAERVGDVAVIRRAWLGEEELP